MTYTLTVNPDGTTTIQVDFADEEVSMTGETSVKGGEAEALRYLSFFESDLRNNFAERFPVPEVLPPGGEM